MIRLSVFLAARPGEVRGLAAALRSVMGQALAQPGCLDANLSTDFTNPDALHYGELWTSETRFREQVGSERFKRLIGVIEAAAEPPRLELQVVSQTRGLDYIEAVLEGRSEPPGDPR